MAKKTSKKAAKKVAAPPSKKNAPGKKEYGMHTKAAPPPGYSMKAPDKTPGEIEEEED
jgi:hypothetical protein